MLSYQFISYVHDYIHYLFLCLLVCMSLHVVPLHKYHRSNLTDRLQALPIPSHSVPVRVVPGSVKKASHCAISTAVGATSTGIQSKGGQKTSKNIQNP